LSSSKLHHLISLAEEPSSERRRELLREVTDLFFASDIAGQPTQMALFDDVLGRLAGDMEEAVRQALAEQMSQSEHAPRNLLRSLAQDSIAVAEPILTSAPGLGVEDQVVLARTLGQEHLRALSQRPDVSERVTDAIVDRGDDQTLGVLLRNDSAQLSRASHETAVDRAATNPELHAAVVDRASLPPDLLNEMYFIVEARLRDRIMDRNAELDPADLDAALRAGRKHIAVQDGALPADYGEAERAVQALQIRGELTPPALVAMLRRRETTRFLVAFSEMVDIDFHTARRIIERRDVDALAIVCKAADFERALFLTFAVLILGPQADVLSRANEYGGLYADLPKDSALRTIRFWRMRRTTGDVAAA
jgi:uncharacterized protein (DUF2336 family)